MMSGFYQNICLTQKTEPPAFRNSPVSTGWTTFLTGVPPEQSGFWSQLRLANGSYRVDEVGGYPYDTYPPFYALGPDFRVAAVDIPHSGLSDKVSKALKKQGFSFVGSTICYSFLQAGGKVTSRS